MSIEDNQKIRSVILRKFYDLNESDPENVFGFDEFLKEGFSENDIILNVRYLDRKGLLKVIWDIGHRMPQVAMITPYGMDVVEAPETVGSQLSFVQNNIQIIKGDATNSVIAQSSGNQSINITDSFNHIYAEIDATEDLDEHSKGKLISDVQEIEKHLDSDKIDLHWLKDKVRKVKDNAAWIAPMLQEIIMEATKKYLGF